MADNWVPYVVRPGDHLLKVAARMGFDADAVWNDHRNADLGKTRASMHILGSGDLLYVPQPKPPVFHRLKIGEVNRFVVDMPLVDIRVTFLDQGMPLANERCTIRELPRLGELHTDAQGTLAFTTHAVVETVTIEFPDLDTTQTLSIGDLNPTTTGSGAYQRLKNLGFLLDAEGSSPQNIDDERLRQAVLHFQWAFDSEPTGVLDAHTATKLESVHGC
jgi:hypothetical protein